MKYFILIFGLLLVSIAQTQSDKQINKCIKIYNKNKDKGILKLRELIAKEGFGSYVAYETLIEMELYYLQEELNKVAVARENKFEIMSSMKEKMQEETYDEAVDMIEKSALERFVSICRRSTLESVSELGDVYCRVFLVDYEPDSAVSEKGKACFEKSVKYFQEEKFELAELECIKALDEDPDYYEAILYLGDTFWARDNADSAMHFYELAKSLHPTLLKPRKYIIDVLIHQGLYYRAKKECFEAICVYPGFDMKMKLHSILEIENKALNDHRILRSFYLNDTKVDDQLPLGGVWADYRKAKTEISKYCNDEGIIEENGITEDKYLEVYSMRYMLEQNQDNLPEYLEFGWKMKEEGYLEQYVFISQFHVDIYSQFQAFIADENNKEKSIDYIEQFLIGKATTN